MTKIPAQRTFGSLVENIVALYGAHFCNYILPLLTIPYCVRVLGPRAWGLVAFSQAFGIYAGLIVEYGFGLSAVREVARHRDSVEDLSTLVAGVMGARVLLMSGSVVLGCLFQLIAPAFPEGSGILWAGMFWGIVGALNPMWFFQGLERMRVVATADVLAKVIATAAIFAAVHSPADAWRVLIAMSVGSLVSTATGLILIYREVEFRVPTVTDTMDALRGGWTMFLYRSSASLYTAGNAFVLGMLAPPQIVGYFAGAEKMIRALLGLFNPINQAIFPRLSHLAHHSPSSAAKLSRWNLLFMLGAGGTMCIGVLIFAPWLVHVFLGRALTPSITVVRVLSLLLPLVAVNLALGVQWVLPLGLDKPFTLVVLLAGILNLLLAAVLAPLYAHVGMAWAVVIAETIATVGLYIILRRAGVEPFRNRDEVAEHEESCDAAFASVEN